MRSNFSVTKIQLLSLSQGLGTKCLTGFEKNYSFLCPALPLSTGCEICAQVISGGGNPEEGVGSRSTSSFSRQKSGMWKRGVFPWMDHCSWVLCSQFVVCGFWRVGLECRHPVQGQECSVLPSALTQELCPSSQIQQRWE